MHFGTDWRRVRVCLRVYLFELLQKLLSVIVSLVGVSAVRPECSIRPVAHLVPCTYALYVVSVTYTFYFWFHHQFHPTSIM